MRDRKLFHARLRPLYLILCKNLVHRSEKMNSLRGKTALITGAGRGIGQATAY